MKSERAINIAIGCVMASFLDSEAKQVVIEALNKMSIPKTESFCPNCGQKIDWSEE